MKPPTFEYFAPTTLDETLELLAQWGAGGRALAGGQSLLPLLNMRVAHPAALIDLNQLSADLEYIRQEGETLVIGALTRHYQIEESALIRRICPLMAEAAAAIGSPAIRTRGTIGGSLAYADPVAELPLALSCLGASVILASPAGRRVVALDDWLRGPFATAIAPGELLVEARIPCPVAGAGAALEEISQGFNRPALVAAASVIALDAQGWVVQARLALSGAGAAARRAPAAETALIGQAPTKALLAQIAELAAQGVAFAGDDRASAALRRRLAATATQRALTQSMRRATQA